MGNKPDWVGQSYKKINSSIEPPTKSAVLFDGQDKAYVGVDHGKKPDIPEKDMERLKLIASKYGAWFEGDGGDKKSISLESNKFRGSWDNKMQKRIPGYPPEFLYTLFTNTEVNKQAREITNAGSTIFESILKAQDKVGYLKDRKFDSQTLKDFLVAASNGSTDLMAMSQKNASPENVKRFLSAGERLMWPSNWEQAPNSAGKLAKKVNDKRQEFLIEQPAGVYMVGSDHIKDIKQKIGAGG